MISQHGDKEPEFLKKKKKKKKKKIPMWDGEVC